MSYDAIQFLFADAVVFVIIQLFVAAILVYAGIFGRKKAARGLHGAQPSHFVLAYSVLSASVIQAVSAADMFSGFKMVVTLADLSAAFYLCFYNDWFRGIVAEVLSSVNGRTRARARV